MEFRPGHYWARVVGGAVSPVAAGKWQVIWLGEYGDHYYLDQMGDDHGGEVTVADGLVYAYWGKTLLFELGPRIEEPGQ